MAWLIDATASMGPYIDAVRQHAKNALVRLALRHPGIGISCGFYRDHDCTEPFQFFGQGLPTEGEFVGAPGAGRVQRFLDEAGYVESNATSVEALGAGLFYASQLPWSAEQRVLVCVGDHPSHGFAPLGSLGGETDSIELCDLRMTHERIVACLMAAKLKCYMVRCGANAAAEQQYRDIAGRTGGRFIDFRNGALADSFMIVIEAALEDSNGGDARRLIEERQRAGLLGEKSVRALLESFDDRG